MLRYELTIEDPEYLSVPTDYTAMSRTAMAAT
jgi:hypothetical protein